MELFEYEVPYSKELKEKFEKISKSDDMLFYIINICCYSLYIYHMKKQTNVNIMIPILRAIDSNNNSLTLKLEISEQATVKEFLLYVRSKVAECYNNNIDIHMDDADCNYIISYNKLHNDISINNISNHIYLKILIENEETKAKLCTSGDYYSSFVYTDFAVRFSSYCLTVFSDINRKVKELDVFTREELTVFKNCLVGKRTEDYLSFDICENMKLLSKRFPDKIALVINDYNYTYKDLWSKICKVAYVLNKKREAGIVAIWGKYNFNMIVATFATLVVNKAYFPIDCNMPHDRLAKALNSLKCNLILEYDKEQFDGVESIMIDSIISEFEDFEYKRDDNKNKIAYVMYTSGTTGEPKAIPVKYSSLANYICWKKEVYQYNEKVISLQVLSYNFDAFCSNLYPVLLFGGKMVMPSKEDQKNFSKVLKLIEQEQVNEFNLVPSYYINLLNLCKDNELGSVKRVILGGESTLPDVVRMSKEKYDFIELVNEYGPTETTITATYMRNMGIDNLKVIGKVINNEKVYVVNEEGKQLYPGIPGELCICGAGVMEGYLNEVNSECFFIVDGNKVYRTGDIVRYNMYGEIEFLSRKNNQISLNGYRIDLEEIENCIMQSDLVKDCMTVTRKDKYGNKYLCAFIVKKVDRNVDIDIMSSYMKENFAEYMIPKQFVLVEEVPYSLNGKKDRNMLANMPIHTMNILSKHNVEPQTRTEQWIHDIWGNLLERERISCIDNFFDIGGNSLLVMELDKIVKEQLGVNIPITDYFTYYTIKSLSAHIDLIDITSKGA